MRFMQVEVGIRRLLLDIYEACGVCNQHTFMTKKEICFYFSR